MDRPPELHTPETRRWTGAAERPAAGLPDAELRPAEQGPRRVLVACPDAVLGLAVEELLKASALAIAPGGMTLGRAHDGLACLEVLETWQPALLILHLGLERVRPAELLASHRAAHPGAPLRLLLLSPLFGRDLPLSLKDEPTLVLPLDHRELLAEVGRLLDLEPASA